MSASSVVAGQEPSSAANSRSLSVSIVIAPAYRSATCKGGGPLGGIEGTGRSASQPIAKGRLGKRVEFGYKGQIVDNDDGIVLDHDVQAGNPADAKQLAPAIQRVKDRAGRAPRRQQLERRRTFRRTVKWRTGCERRISTLKRAYGWDRT